MVGCMGAFSRALQLGFREPGPHRGQDCPLRGICEALEILHGHDSISVTSQGVAGAWQVSRWFTSPEMLEDMQLQRDVSACIKSASIDTLLILLRALKQGRAHDRRQSGRALPFDL